MLQGFYASIDEEALVRHELGVAAGKQCGGIRCVETDHAVHVLTVAVPRRTRVHEAYLPVRSREIDRCRGPGESASDDNDVKVLTRKACCVGREFLALGDVASKASETFAQRPCICR